MVDVLGLVSKDVSKWSETNIAAAVAIRSLGRCGSAFNKRTLLRRHDNTDAEPFPQKTIADCPSIRYGETRSFRQEFHPMFCVLGLKIGMFSSPGVQRARLFEYYRDES